MKSVKLEFDPHPFLNKEANDYLNDEVALRPFRAFAPDLDNIQDAIEGRKDFSIPNRESLARQRKQRPSRRVKLPRDGKGGVMPGVDLTNSAELLDIMEGRHGPS